MHSPKWPLLKPLREGLWLVIELCDELLENGCEPWDPYELHAIRNQCYDSLFITRHMVPYNDLTGSPLPDPAA